MCLTAVFSVERLAHNRELKTNQVLLEKQNRKLAIQNQQLQNFFDDFFKKKKKGPAGKVLKNGKWVNPC
jgi:hypothetical protein